MKNCFFIALLLVGGLAGAAEDLRLSVYATAGTVVKLADEEAARDEALAKMRWLGITRVFVEVYRSGLVVPPEKLEAVRDFFRENGIGVAGGIATTPGEGFGVEADVGLHWFNYQAPETREALERVMRQSAPLFDTFIVDDFLCTGDKSEISDKARGDRSWSQYRRDLMVEVSRKVIIEPAKEVNPDIDLIIKYPQWYDLFHKFGYDVARQPAMFDGVWVGTETRGATTQRYGFVQPYEGFINYRWIAALSGGKIRGAWFDHGDCGDFDFLDQAWQSVLAGAPELMIFNLGNVLKGHPDHARLREDWPKLEKLAAAMRENPVVGPVGYKPPNSDAGGDLYIMDFIGMLGVSLVPSPVFPEDAETIFLPTQAAADPDIAKKVKAALAAGKNIVMTAGFVSKVPGMAELAGLKGPVALKPMKTDEEGLDLAADLTVDGAEVLLQAPVEGRNVPFLTRRGNVTVLNTRTFSQADFDAVGEVLLSPRDLGIVHLPEEWLKIIRTAFGHGADWMFHAPARVTCQKLGPSGWVIQNYNDSAAECGFGFAKPVNLQAALTGEPLDRLFTLPARGRLWVERAE